MDKEVANKLKSKKWKKGTRKDPKRFQVHNLSQVDWIVQRKIEKEDRVKFNDAWSIVVIKDVGEIFHNNFRFGLIITSA